jgi:hypothetical protein
MKKTYLIFSLAVILTLSLLTVSGLTWAQCIPSGNSVSGSLASGDPEFGTRIFRDGVISACDPPKAYPDTYPSGGYYDLYTYPNGCWQDTCVTVAFNQGTCYVGGTGNAHISAWSTGFDPTDTSTWSASYLGDLGSSESQSFSFPVAANTTFYLFVQNPHGTFACDYSFTISATPCDPTSICQDSCAGQLCYYNCIPGSCPASHCDIFLPGPPQFGRVIGQLTYSWPGCVPGGCPPSACSVYVPLLGP